MTIPLTAEGSEMISSYRTLPGCAPTGRTVVTWNDPCASLSETRYDETDPQRAYFEALADRWETETSHLSSASRITGHPAFTTLSRMRNQYTIRWALKRLKNNVSWSFVLNQIAPNPPRIRSDGDSRKLKAGWLKWATENGYKAR